MRQERAYRSLEVAKSSVQVGHLSCLEPAWKEERGVFG